MTTSALIKDLANYAENNIADCDYSPLDVNIEIILKPDGTREIKSYHPGKNILCPSIPNKTGSDTIHRFLIESIDWVFGIQKPVSKDDDKLNEKKLKKRFENFWKNTLKQLEKASAESDKYSEEEIKNIKKIIDYLRSYYNKIIENDTEIKEIEKIKYVLSQDEKNKYNVVFSLEEPGKYIHDFDFIKKIFINQENANNTVNIPCMYGTSEKSSKLHLKLKFKGFSGKIVSFDDKSFCSYNKKGGENCPIGYDMMKRYVGAFNLLADKESNHIDLYNGAVLIWFSDEIENGNDSFIKTWLDSPKKAIVEVNEDTEYPSDFSFAVVESAGGGYRAFVSDYRKVKGKEIIKNIVDFSNSINKIVKNDNINIEDILRSLKDLNKKARIFSPNELCDLRRNLYLNALFGDNLNKNHLKKIIRLLSKATMFYNKKTKDCRNILLILSLSLKEGVGNMKNSIGFKLGRFLAASEKHQQEHHKYNLSGKSFARSNLENFLKQPRKYFIQIGLKNKDLISSREKVIKEILHSIPDGIPNGIPAQLDDEQKSLLLIGFSWQEVEFFNKKQENKENKEEENKEEENKEENENE